MRDLHGFDSVSAKAKEIQKPTIPNAISGGIHVSHQLKITNRSLMTEKTPKTPRLKYILTE